MTEPHTHPEGALPASAGGASPALKPCPFCGSSDLALEGLLTDVQGELCAGLENPPKPPPGGWPEGDTAHIRCNGCGAYGPLGYTLTADFSRCIPSAGWNDRAGEVRS